MKMDGTRSFVLKETSQIKKIQCYIFIYVEWERGRKEDGRRGQMKVDREGDQREEEVSAMGDKYENLYTCLQNIANCFIYLEYTNKIKWVTVFYTR